MWRLSLGIFAEEIPVMKLQVHNISQMRQLNDFPFCCFLSETHRCFILYSSLDPQSSPCD